MPPARVDQAIFSSAHTSTHDGYQLLATSPGVTRAESELLTVWSPSHDSLLTSCAEGCLNFFPCAERYCLSRTVAAGAEYSGRQGPRIYTHCFLLERETLDRFAHNAFAAWIALAAAGRFEVYDSPPRSLLPFFLVGRTPPLDEELVWQAETVLGSAAIVALLDAALREPRLAICGHDQLELCFAALVNLLPLESRLYLSFSTGLRPSLRRPFRLVVAPDDPSEQRLLSLRLEARMMNLSTLPDTYSPRHPWAQRVHEALVAQRIRQLVRC